MRLNCGRNIFHIQNFYMVNMKIVRKSCKKIGQEKKLLKDYSTIKANDRKQNLHSKIAPSRGHLLVEERTILAIWLRSYCFRNKTFLFFKDRKLKLSVSVWNWISWNLTKFQLIQIIQAISYFYFFNLLSDWVEILWGVMTFFLKQMLKIAVFYLEKQNKI